MFDPNDMLLVIGEQTMRLKLAEHDLAEARANCQILAADNENLRVIIEQPAKTSPKKRRRAS